MGGVDGDKSLTKDKSPEELEAFREVLAEAVSILDDDGAPYVLSGSLAGDRWGRPTTPGDLDIVVHPADVKRLVKAFDAAGYETDIEDPQWLYKAKKDPVTVDLIFEMEGSLYLDDEMVEHGVVTEVEGTTARLMAPEDYVLSQALSFKEDTPDYWHNGLAVLGKTELDWDYLVERARRGPRRILSLLTFAQAIDISVPDKPIRDIFASIYQS